MAKQTNKAARYILNKKAGVPPTNQDTADVLEGDLPEAAEAHGKVDDNTGIVRPKTELPSKLGGLVIAMKGFADEEMEVASGADETYKTAAEMTTAKALKLAEDVFEDLQALYLKAKPLTQVNESRPVREGVEAIYMAMNKLSEASKILSKQQRQEEQEEETTEAQKKKKSSIDASTPEDWTAEKKATFGGLKIAGADDSFYDAYVAAALWSTSSDGAPRGGEMLDEEYSQEDFAPATVHQMMADCESFQSQNADLLSQYYEALPVQAWSPEAQAGHDFWLSRNGHGSGFFDREVPDEIKDPLQEAASDYGEFELYVGDDDLIYASGYEDSMPEPETKVDPKMGGLKIAGSEGGPAGSPGKRQVVPPASPANEHIDNLLLEYLDNNPIPDRLYLDSTNGEVTLVRPDHDYYYTRQRGSLEELVKNRRSKYGSGYGCGECGHSFDHHNRPPDFSCDICDAEECHGWSDEKVKKAAGPITPEILSEKLKTLPNHFKDMNIFRSRGCDAFALALQEFLTKQGEGSQLEAISRITVDEYGEEDENVLSHVIVEWGGTTWDALGPNAFTRWEEAWIDNYGEETTFEAYDITGKEIDAVRRKNKEKRDTALQAEVLAFLNGKVKAKKATHSSRSGRVQFSHLLKEHAPKVQDGSINKHVADTVAEELMRLGHAYKNIQGLWLGEQMDPESEAKFQQKEHEIEERIQGFASQLGVTAQFDGDPQNSTIRILLPDGFSTDPSTQGICVPTS